MFKRLLFLAVAAVLVLSYNYSNAIGLTMSVSTEENDTASTLKNTQLAIRYNALAEKFMYEDADSSLYYSAKAYTAATASNNFKEVTRALTNQGMTNYVKGAYFASLEATTKLMDLSVEHKYKQGIGNSYHIRGLIYLAQDEFDDAIIEFEKALKIFRQLNNQPKLVRVLFNIGLCYDEKREPQRAFKYLDETIAISQAIKDEHMIAMGYNRKGETYYHSKDYARAIAFHNSVIDGPYQDKWENAFAYSGLAQAQLELKDYKAALANALKSVQLAAEVKSLWDEVRALNIAAKAYAAIGDDKLAYKYLRLKDRKDDNLLNESKRSKLNNLHLQQQRLENLQLEKENELHIQKIKFNRLLIAGIGLLTLCIAIFAVVISRSNVYKTSLNKKLERQNRAIARQKEEISVQNEKLDQLNRTKNQLFSVVSHDLRGPFASIAQTLELFRDGYITAEERDDILDHFEQQVNHLSIMVNNMLAWANSQLAGAQSRAEALDCAQTVEEVLSVYHYQAGQKDIVINHQFEGVHPVYADPDHLRIITQNTIGNALKFTRPGGEIKIFYSDDATFQVLHIKDNGIGIPADKMQKLFKVVGKGISGAGTQNEVGAGIGLLLIKQFVEMNKGQLKIISEADKGTDVVIYLPKTTSA